MASFPTIPAPQFLFTSCRHYSNSKRESHGPPVLRRVRTKPIAFCSPSTSVVEDPSVPTLDGIPMERESAGEDEGNLTLRAMHRGCKACGREVLEKGCNGEGRVQGGIATVPGFGWWPIKAFRPCPGFVASGGRYKRRGQSMDEVAFGRGERNAPMRNIDEAQSRKRDLRFLLSDRLPEMEPETRRRIEETVVEILKNADMDEMTEFKVRNMAAEKLGIDLSGSEHKGLVRSVVKSFLLSREADEEDEQQQVKGTATDGVTKEVDEQEGEEQETKRSVSSKEYDDDGDLIMCWLSSRRRVTIQDFRGKTLVSIREYYQKDGKQLPTSKGISLTSEQWSALKKNLPAIEDAIQKMEARLR